MSYHPLFPIVPIMRLAPFSCLFGERKLIEMVVVSARNVVQHDKIIKVYNICHLFDHEPPILFLSSNIIIQYDSTV